MNKIKMKVVYFLLHLNCNSSRVFLTMSSYLWAFLLLLPGDTFDKQSYILMSKIAPEMFWAVAFLCYAIISTLNLNFIFDSKYLKLAEAIVGFLIWTTAAVGIYMSTAQAPAVAAPHIVGACMSWWILIRTGLKNG